MAMKHALFLLVVLALVTGGSCQSEALGNNTFAGWIIGLIVTISMVVGFLCCVGCTTVCLCKRSRENARQHHPPPERPYEMRSEYGRDVYGNLIRISGHPSNTPVNVPATASRIISAPDPSQLPHGAVTIDPHSDLPSYVAVMTNINEFEAVLPQDLSNDHLPTYSPSNQLPTSTAHGPPPYAIGADDSSTSSVYTSQPIGDSHHQLEDSYPSGDQNHQTEENFHPPDSSDQPTSIDNDNIQVQLSEDVSLDIQHSQSSCDPPPSYTMTSGDDH
jgi:hypothetical protein